MMGFGAIVGTLAALLLYNIIRERRIVRKTGMSPQRPVCAKCLYPLGGWSTSRCPECGCDTKEHGVRIGPQWIQYSLFALTIIISLFGMGRLAAALSGWAFKTQNYRWHTRWTAVDPPVYHVTITAQWNWCRFPPHNDFAGEIEFVRINLNAQGSWTNGKWMGPADAKHVIKFHSGNRPPSRQDIVAAVTAMVGATDATATQLHDQQIDALTNELAALWRKANFGAIISQRNTILPAGQLFKGIGAGYGGGSSTHWIGWLCSAVAVLGFIFAGTVLINRKCRVGWRPVEPGEWMNFRN